MYWRSARAELRVLSTVAEPPALDQLAAAVPAKRVGDVIETPNIIRPDTLGSCGRREVHRTPAFICPRPDANIDDGRCGST
jgi:hypothetical protein